MSALVLESGALGRKFSDFGQVSLGRRGSGLSCAGRGVCPPPAVERGQSSVGVFNSHQLTRTLRVHLRRTETFRKLTDNTCAQHVSQGENIYLGWLSGNELQELGMGFQSCHRWSRCVSLHKSLSPSFSSVHWSLTIWNGSRGPSGFTLLWCFTSVLSQESKRQNCKKLYPFFHLWEKMLLWRGPRLTPTWGRRQLNTEENTRESALNLECKRTLMWQE